MDCRRVYNLTLEEKKGNFYTSQLETSVLNNRQASYVDDNNFLPEFQSGFRPGRSCTENIFTFNALTQINTIQQKGKIYALFVDFKRAFDSVCHDKLWQKLYTLVGLSANFLNVIMNFYSKASLLVRTKQGLSDPIHITEGILQGEVLSPYLFSLFLSDLEIFFRERGVRGVAINHWRDLLFLAYADDLILLAYSPIDLKKNSVSCTTTV